MTDQRESHLPDPVRADFLKLFLEHQDDLRAFIGAVVRDSAQRDDVFQEVAMELWRGFDRYDPQRSFGAWARGVAKHRVMKHYRSEGRVPMPLSPAAVEATLNAFDAIDDFRGAATDWKDALEACLQQMPAQSRKLLSMRYDNESDIGNARISGQSDSGTTAKNARARSLPIYWQTRRVGSCRSRIRCYVSLMDAA
ncbi:MAG: sigma-70 family RNA polymerase sigma factor [Verrucomicrobiales bacterium]